MPALRCSIHEKISRLDADDWDDVVRASRSDILMSHEFVAAVEEAFDDQARVRARDHLRRSASGGLRKPLCFSDRR